MNTDSAFATKDLLLAVLSPEGRTHEKAEKG
jgi:hypothetical protein